MAAMWLRPRSKLRDFLMAKEPK
ncbi:hypothetical protein CCACVL1_02214 [Corchorus capsularis]|uniref:Uncharacterized protein n=1 Tax=Corchorus capsularis TaxID=210143 RepID=A0A1R3KAG0_COCAP|nr:hypothetical protein CCACVL1_02214 [Corchorus capsularis]